MIGKYVMFVDSDDIIAPNSIQTLMETAILYNAEIVEGSYQDFDSNGIKNTYYVDNLMWMWDKIPDGLLTVKKYFISEIIPSKENFNKIGKKIVNPRSKRF